MAVCAAEGVAGGGCSICTSGFVGGVGVEGKITPVHCVGSVKATCVTGMGATQCRMTGLAVRLTAPAWSHISTLAVTVAFYV